MFFTSDIKRVSEKFGQWKASVIKDMTEITPLSRKRASVQKPNWNKCLCHVKEIVDDKLTSFSEVETALAETQIAKQGNGVFVPSACHPNVSGVLCWDNNDLQEETLSVKCSVFSFTLCFQSI